MRGRLRVLIADDNADCVIALATLLEGRGHSVRQAVDGPTALETALIFQPHVIVLDLGTPLIDGYIVSTRVQREGWARDVLIVALSGHGGFSDRVCSQDCGFDYHVTKPADFDELTKLVERSDSTLHQRSKLLRPPSCSIDRERRSQALSEPW